ncbi:MAG: biotin--[acetyl-CoA-carboxylase] ligase [Casimicrobium sp.]
MSAVFQFSCERIATIDSTNAELLRRTGSKDVHGTALSADVQTAGRGQRGRRWHAAAGDALLLSLAWRFSKGERLDGLSLAVGVAAARAAQRFANERITLKWPNDLLIDDRAKLGGILIETLPEANQSRIAVIGIGINIRAPQLGEFERSAAPDALAPAALLSNVLPRNADGALIVRDALEQSLLTELATMLPEFAARGFVAFRDAWWAQRAYADARVRIANAGTRGTESIATDTNAQVGRIAAIDDNGALVIDDGRTLHTLHSGALSLRPL